MRKKKTFFNKFKSLFSKKCSKTVCTKKEIHDSQCVREIIVERNNGFNTLEVLIIVIITTLFGLIVGYTLSLARGNTGTRVSDEVLEIITTYENILENYYEDVDKTQLLDAAVSGMINVLDDPYSVFLDSEDTKSFDETVNGSFVGVGITVEWFENKFRVIEVLDGSPAHKAKVQKDDYILQIDDTLVDGMNLTDVSHLIKGKKGSKVSLVLLRGNDRVEVTMKRSVIEIPSVYSKELSEHIGYMSIDSFASNTAEQFEKQLKKLEKKGINSLIIDVRGNPGGRLSEVNDILDLFLPKNEILYKIETKGKVEEILSEDNSMRKYSVIVLTDRGSASASEILAACFQDNYDKAVVVGTVTYGKGTIQKAVKLSSGATVKYTTQKWLTPNDVWINEVGLMPDVLIEQGEEYNSNPSDSNDLQLIKAIELLKK